MRGHLLKLSAIVVIAMAGLVLAFDAGQASAPAVESFACSTPSGGQCTGAKCCTIDDACFDDCPIKIEE